MEPFATPDDIESRWRPLSADEMALASTLIDDASDVVRSRWPDIDDRIALGALPSARATRVVASMVKRAMMNRDSEGVTQAQQGTGPFTQSLTYSNPTGNLYLTGDEIKALSPNGFIGVRQAWL